MIWDAISNSVKLLHAINGIIPLQMGLLPAQCVGPQDIFFAIGAYAMGAL
jgi:hypothetical protein